MDYDYAFEDVVLRRRKENQNIQYHKCGFATGRFSHKKESVRIARLEHISPRINVKSIVNFKN